MNTHPDPLTRPVSSLAGIGPQTALRLQKMGIHTWQDLLFHLPYRYQDRSHHRSITSLNSGDLALVMGQIESIAPPKRRGSPLTVRISDDTGLLNLRFFHYSAYLIQQMSEGMMIGCFGEVRFGFSGLEIIHPEFRLGNKASSLIDQHLIPVYPATEGISQSLLRKAITQVIDEISLTRNLIDWLPPELTKPKGLPTLTGSLIFLHHPPIASDATAETIRQSPAFKRLAYEEFLAHHLARIQHKTRSKQWQAYPIPSHEADKQRFLDNLPFLPTGAQTRVIQEIEQDLALSHPMLRLVQGDVGCGKTLVAAVAALMAVRAGHQIALMAPTELLAEQHFANFQHWFLPFGINTVYLSGQTKGKRRAEVLTQLSDGSANIIIGTHALFQETVEFKDLALIIIDEQHRFGVHQRHALREKGLKHQLIPHQLIMTATPIPRTLAMLSFSDLDLSVIDELPPNRQPVTTRVISEQKREDIIARILQLIGQGQQVYWVCPLIDESEQLQCEAAETTVLNLRQLLPSIRIGLLHGRMKASEKEIAMQTFKRHETDLLVATTVIEVGVDVPNASLMIIENAERLGLSQLHQLRGRVGRGHQESFCLLLYHGPLSEVGKKRLSIIKESHDGFHIAEQDLLIRGPGELMGTRQTGQMSFKIADLLEDAELIDQISGDAQYLLKQHSESIPPLITRWIGDEKRMYNNIA